MLHRRSPGRLGLTLTGLLAAVAALVAAFALQASHPAPAAALCAAPAEVGDWHNIAATNGMTRVVVGMECGDVVTCDADTGVCSGGDTYETIRAFGRCHPTDCDWGTRRASDMGGGWQMATFNFGFKTSNVWVKTYQYWGLTYLRVWVYNDFAPSDGRADYSTDDWFLK
jgi:hypothetical protein